MLIRFTRNVAARLGIEVRRADGNTVRPEATYAPWRHDQEFQRICGQVRHNTMVDVLRLWELWTLIEQVAHVPGDVVEVGVWRGGSGALIAYRMKQLGLPAVMYLCDTFHGIVKSGEHDPLYRGGELSDTSAAVVHELHSRLALDNIEILEGVFPEETGQAIPSDTIRFCHIDVDVYQSAEDILAWVWPKLSIGGLLVYDDYGFPTCAGITKHVNQQRTLSDRIVIHNLNGHAIVVKTQ